MSVRACEACRAAHAPCSHTLPCARCRKDARACVYRAVLGRAAEPVVFLETAAAVAPVAANGVGAVLPRCQRCARRHERCDRTSAYAGAVRRASSPGGCVACHVAGVACSSAAAAAAAAAVPNAAAAAAAAVPNAASAAGAPEWADVVVAVPVLRNPRQARLLAAVVAERAALPAWRAAAAEPEPEHAPRPPGHATRFVNSRDMFYSAFQP